MKFRNCLSVVLFWVFSCFGSTLCYKPVTYMTNMVTSHPFITALVIVVTLSEEPLDTIKNIASYCIEEHPVLTIILLGLILSGSWDDLASLQQVASSLTRYSSRLLYLLIRIAQRTYP